MKTNKPLREKEKLFCAYFSESRNARSAAAKAGYGIFAQKHAVRLMAREDIREQIERMDSASGVSRQEVAAGYRRLAFGTVADAVRLAFREDDPGLPELEGLDLFNVSEIKRPKGGGIEIKFFDRLKALEHLEALSTGNDGEDSLPFYMALEKSAAALRNDADE